MKKLVVLFLFVVAVFTSCPGVVVPKNVHSVARIKEKYTCNIQIENRSSYNLEYKYAPVPTRTDFNELIFIKEYNDSVKKILNETNLDAATYNIYNLPVKPLFINVYGTLSKETKSKNLYTGIDCGVPDSINPIKLSYSNINVDGLPARFVLMIEGDSRVYSLVYNCEKKNETSTVVITDDTIKRLQTFKDDEFKRGYNGRRDFYGKSVEIGDRFYCFERIDIKKNSLKEYLKDYREISEMNFGGILYARVFLACWFERRYPGLPIVIDDKKVLILYHDNEEKFYYVKGDASVNPIE